MKSKRCRWPAFFLCGNLMLLTGSLQAQDDPVRFRWLELPAMPASPGQTHQPGLAGPVAGIVGEALLVGGGANFPDAPPWRGGVKVYHDVIHLLRETPAGSFSWSLSGQRLPVPMAYPACVTVNGGILSLGGETSLGPIQDVMFLRLVRDSLEIKQFPRLPVGVAAGGAASIGTKVYHIGGYTAKGATAGFFVLDLTQPDAGWTTLPDLPVPLSHAVVAACRDEAGPCLFVIGGRNKTGEWSTFLASVWKFSLETRTWSEATPIPSMDGHAGLAAGTGLAIDDHRIALFGGDPGIFFNRTERLIAATDQATGTSRDSLVKERIERMENHPGFDRHIRIFNTLNHDWIDAGLMPGPAPVTTTALFWGDRIIIPSGEIRPGVRTPGILAAEIQRSN